ncbi:MAG: ChaN family lipoprotein [Bacteroidales bacterium]|nr:ChaN family lipoprotein [Bacteroidales bacterium]
MKTKTFFFLLISMSLLAFKSDKHAFRVFNSEGKRVKYQKMLENLEGADIVFFGELHDNPIAHWLQYELTRDLYNIEGENLVLAAEMFEADNQLLMNEYLGGQISEKKFEDEMRLWNNYKTDYKPLVVFAKENNLHFVASNIPRRYASVVYKKGFEGLEELSDEAKKYFHPLPVPYDSEVECYKAMMEMGGMGAKANENLPKAQAVKDATMAYFILQNRQEGEMVIHYNGSYHSDNHQGIIWYLQQKQPDLKIVTITTKLQEEIDEVETENIGSADFIILVPETMTRTYR